MTHPHPASAQPGDAVVRRGLAAELIEVGQRFDRRGWVPATSSNFSARLADGQTLITVSGPHKGRLSEADFLTVDAAGTPLGDVRRPSAETALHLMLYEQFGPACQAVLHTHSVTGTVLGRLSPQGVDFEDYELQKAFPGVGTHEGRMTLPVLPNTQNIPGLAADARAWFAAEPPAVPGLLIAGHGLYAWGDSVAAAERHIEALEFLMECVVLEWRLTQ